MAEESADKTLMPFGKYKGSSYTEFSKLKFRAYLEPHQRGMFVFIKHPELYCEMHNFAEEKWPDWISGVHLLCDCEKIRWMKVNNMEE